MTPLGRPLSLAYVSTGQEVGTWLEQKKHKGDTPILEL